MNRFLFRCGVVILANIALVGGMSAAVPRTDDRVTAHFSDMEGPLANPERGFYRAGRDDLEHLEPAFLEGAYRDGYRLIYARINLEPFRNRALPTEYLDKLETGFAAARHAGVKLIVRAVYNYPHGETDYRDARDAPLPIVLGHLSQLKPLLHANSDVIAFVQAGLIGAWGEWHTSSNGLTEPAARTAIKDALLAAAPADRFVQFRYPPYIRDWIRQLPSRGMRIGFHNDCFLASRTDVGTFSEDAAVRAGEQAFLDRLGDVAPFGGETCNPADDPAAVPRTTCADILREGARYNLTYLNADYYRGLFHDAWQAGGCYDQVAGKMGYRIRLLDTVHDSHVAAKTNLRMLITIRNDGWARPSNPRGITLLLRDSRGVRRLPVAGVDLREWLPGATRSVPLDVALPANIESGNYDLLIAFPDASSQLRSDPRYAIRPANADDSARGQAWESALGAFRTGTIVHVQD